MQLVRRNPSTSSVHLVEPHLGAWRALLGARAALIDRIEEALAAAELPPLAWYDVLHALYLAPERRLRMGELAGEMVAIGRTGLTRLVDRIEGAGLVRREPVAGDRRGSYTVLTEEGEHVLLERMWPVYASEIEDRFAKLLSDDEAELLRETLSRVMGAARESRRSPA